MRPWSVGPFDVQTRLAEGGMGQIWQAVHSESRVPVAIKVLTARAARDPWYLERFHREVRAVAGLSHPGIALLFDYGDLPRSAEAATDGALVEGSPYLVMELARGGTLARWLKVRPPWEHLQAALLLLLDALAHAHAREVIHRDLKPGNVLICARGDSRPGLKISDFGIAHRRGEAGGGPAAEVLGTPGYMAPEQWCEDAWSLGPWTDLFALGAMARGILEGRPPGSRQPALPLPPLPPGVEEWLNRMTDPDPGRRYQRAADASEDLSRLGGAVEPLLQAGLLSLVLEDAGAVPVTANSQPTWNPHSERRTLTLEALEDQRSLSSAVPPSVVERPVPVPERWRRADPPALPPSLVGAGLNLYGLRVPPLVGRDAEMDGLWRALRQVRASGAPVAAVVSGPEGIGKSHLVATLAERAHELGVAEVLRATHHERPGPDDGVFAALARMIGVRDEPEHEALERVGLWLGQPPEHPSVAALLGPLRAASGGGVSGPDPQRLGALLPALARLARRRVLILWLEDASGSAEALSLARWILERAPLLPILVVLTLREQDPADAVEPLSLQPNTVALRLGPLPSGHRDLLVRSLLDLDPALRSEVLARAGGHPRLVSELIGEWARRGLLSPAPRGFTLRRGASLGEEGQVSGSPRMSGFYAARTEPERLALERAAVLGLEVELDLWGAMAPEARPLLEPLTRAMLDAGLARSGGAGSWSWAHFQCREAVLAAAGDRARAHHLAAAAALRGATGPGVPERVGLHHHAAGAWADCLDPLLEGARRRLRAGEPERCLAVLDAHAAALDALGTSTLDPQWARHWAARVSAAGDRGLMDEVYRCLGAMNDAADRALADPANPSRSIWLESWVRSQVQMAQLVDKRGRPLEALRICGGALKRASEHEDATLEAIVCRCGANALHHLGDLEESEAWLARGREAALRGSDPEMVHRLDYTLAALLLTRGELSRAAEVIGRALVGFRAAGLRWFVASALNLQGEVARGLGQLDEAERCYREAWEVHQAIYSVEVVTLAINLGIVALLQGRYAASLGHLEQALSDAERLRWTSHALGARAALLVTFAGTGAWDAFDPQLTALRQGLERHGVRIRDVPELAELAGQLALRAGEVQRARAVLRLAEAQWRDLDRHDLAQRVAAQLAQVSG